MAGRGCGLLGGVKGAPEKVPAVNQVLKGRKEGSHSRPAGQQVRRQQKIAKAKSQEQLKGTTGSVFLQVFSCLDDALATRILSTFSQPITCLSL